MWLIGLGRGCGNDFGGLFGRVARLAVDYVIIESIAYLESLSLYVTINLRWNTHLDLCTGSHVLLSRRRVKINGNIDYTNNKQ